MSIAKPTTSIFGACDQSPRLLACSATVQLHAMPPRMEQSFDTPNVFIKYGLACHPSATVWPGQPAKARCSGCLEMLRFGGSTRMTARAWVLCGCLRSKLPCRIMENAVAGRSPGPVLAQDCAIRFCSLRCRWHLWDRPEGFVGPRCRLLPLQECVGPYTRVSSSIPTMV